ncbi:MAG: hypothetical protein NTX53_08965 [candidate division WOR-3 bacterium]|nr:hypothetical protein [candidate division WOR-3 bacterium]
MENRTGPVAPGLTADSSSSAAHENLSDIVLVLGLDDILRSSPSVSIDGWDSTRTW